MTTYFYIPLKDASAFESLMKTSKQEITQKDGLSIMDDGGEAIIETLQSLLKKK